MAPKKPNPAENQRDDSSTEEEEDDEGSSSEESSSEEEAPKRSSPPPPPPQKQQQQQQQPPKKPDSTTIVTPRPQSSSSSSSEFEESESDFGDSDRGKLIKPIATKPMEETPKTTKPRSKPAAGPPKSTAKRGPNENDRDFKDPKKAKKDMVSGSDEGAVEEDSKKDDPKKQLFQRLWSEEDEIAVLKGIFEYSAKKGADPMADMNAFLEYIKDSLHFDVTKVQLHDKIRRLKKKYGNNLGRGKKGEDPTFSKPHEQKAYDLSKKVWGGEVVESSAAAKVNGKPKKMPPPRTNSKNVAVSRITEFLASPDGKKKIQIEGDNVETQGIIEMVDKIKGLSGVEDYVINHGLDLIDGGKRVEFEERWRKVQLAQLELFVERSELVCEQAKLVLEAAKSSKQ
ncbi:DUF573 domain-containing protein [Cephalotus follicularis]|uniref:DUF573 domain-containing protein n=1 Tax=Cephalotus follicularis TaxID=3775 RepID=A0A1Q3BTE5_CEPFO|nr:DUF573 domain-containing protein [Cephalotus follicularis]